MQKEVLIYLIDFLILHLKICCLDIAVFVTPSSTLLAGKVVWIYYF